jgi:hypothetical protein
VRGAPAHQPDKVVVLSRAFRVRHDVSDQLVVELGRGVEAKGHGDVGALEVAVNGLGAADHATRLAAGCAMFQSDVNLMREKR